MNRADKIVDIRKYFLIEWKKKKKKNIVLKAIVYYLF